MDLPEEDRQIHWPLPLHACVHQGYAKNRSIAVIWKESSCLFHESLLVYLMR